MEKKAGFNLFIIFGNQKEGATQEAFDKFGDAIKKYDLKLKLAGAPLGVSEERALLLMGPVTGYEKLIGDAETYPLIPITDARTITVWVLDQYLK